MAAISDLDRARALLADDLDEMDEQWLAGIIAAVLSRSGGRRYANLATSNLILTADQLTTRPSQVLSFNLEPPSG